MRPLPQRSERALTPDERAQVVGDLENAVYAAAWPILEDLEHHGHAVGNGHHVAQEIARFAREALAARFEAAS